MADITFNRAYAGYVYTGRGTVYHRRDDGSFSGIDAYVDGDKAGEKVVATGFMTTARDGSVMLQYVGDDSSFYNWLDLSSGQWKKGEMADLYSQGQAQDYVTRMIENNKQILMNNLFCARFSSRLTEEEKATLYNLQKRLEERNNRLVQDGYVAQVQVSQAYGYNALNKSLTAFMATSGVGLVVSTTAIVVSCVVIAALATAAYFAYKYYYEQSAKDVKYSDSLTKTLMSKLTEEEYNQLMEETQGIVTRATLRARLGSSFSIARLALIAVGAYALYNIITTNYRKYGSKIKRQV